MVPAQNVSEQPGQMSSAYLINRFRWNETESPMINEGRYGIEHSVQKVGSSQLSSALQIVDIM